MVVKLILHFAVLFFSYLQIATTFELKREIQAKKHRAELAKEHPGYGKNYIYTVDQYGDLKRLDLKGDQKCKEIYEKFLKSEELTEAENTGVQSFGGFASEDSGIGNIPEKFNFSRNDITFTLFSRKHKDGVNLTNNFDFSKYEVNKLTKVVTHGFQSSGTAEVCIRIKNNYLEVTDINVIIMDWGKIAANVLYPITVANTAIVADYASNFLAYLIGQVGVSDRHVHLIGHSLGGQVMGFTGKRLILNYDIKISRITGLDPAGPLFKLVHLTKNDAQFVDVIHTNGGALGLNDTMGHVDFYPNNGDSPQPGCEDKNILTVDSCSHGMSWKFFAETIKDVDKYIGNCTDSNMHPMGAKTPPHARGVCDLDTDNSSNGDGDEPKRGFFGFLGFIRRGFKKIYDCIRAIF